MVFVNFLYNVTNGFYKLVFVYEDRYSTFGAFREKDMSGLDLYSAFVRQDNLCLAVGICLESVRRITVAKPDQIRLLVKEQQ